MTIFMLHFDCTTQRAKEHAAHVTGDACVIADSLEQAESLARDEITTHSASAGTLIAYSTVEHSRIAGLSEYETVLYLKACQRKPAVAVMFS